MDKFKVVMASVAPLDLLMADLSAELEQKYRLHVDIELYSLHESGELAVDRRDLSKEMCIRDRLRGWTLFAAWAFLICCSNWWNKTGKV